MSIIPHPTLFSNSPLYRRNNSSYEAPRGYLDEILIIDVTAHSTSLHTAGFDTSRRKLTPIQDVLQLHLFQETHPYQQKK